MASNSDASEALASKIAAWKLTASASSTSVGGARRVQSSISLETVRGSTSRTTGPSSGRRPKRKREDYKVIPDDAFPTFKILRKKAVREAKVTNHLAHIISCLESESIPKGLMVSLKPAFGANQPEFMAAWNSACKELSISLMTKLAERANTELGPLREEIKTITAEMHRLIPAEEDRKKADAYLLEVIEKDAPESKKKKPDFTPRRGDKPAQKGKGPYRSRKNPTESEEDLLYLIRSLKSRRGPRRR